MHQKMMLIFNLSYLCPLDCSNTQKEEQTNINISPIIARFNPAEPVVEKYVIL